VFFEIDHLKGRFHPPGGQSTGRPERGRFRWPSSLTLFTLWIRGDALEIHTIALRRFKPWPNHKLRRPFGQALSQNDQSSFSCAARKRPGSCHGPAMESCLGETVNNGVSAKECHVGEVRVCADHPALRDDTVLPAAVNRISRDIETPRPEGENQSCAYASACAGVPCTISRGGPMFRSGPVRSRRVRLAPGPGPLLHCQTHWVRFLGPARDSGCEVVSTAANQGAGFRSGQPDCGGDSVRDDDGNGEIVAS
jgi:hypothetical protein